jgi:serine phosphatase RsbU (regulator of sigma subunit)/anti-sigma regulatory factor (Ser/Thr protein kinase)
VDGGFEVFHVPVAAGSREVPDQGFVRRYGVSSVLGFGGLLPDGDVFSVVLFSRVPVSRDVADLFRTVAVAARLALLPTVSAPLFHGQSPRPADPWALSAARMRALEQMLDVQQQTVASQAAHLQEALQEAVALRQAAEREMEANELLREVTSLLSAELDLDRLVQVATDAGTRIAGAAFGAFFYNVVRDGEEYMLYTLSGFPRSAFERFPMPRPTAIFRPTFEGADIIRSDDITKDPRYGRNPPYHGMPEGHPKVRSHLAVPVVSRSGEVHGGFFFGHPDIGVFDERAERLVVGIAAQAAIALDNARLYDAERRTALTLQRSLLPQVVEVPDGLEVGYEYLPGGGGVDVGGDWFDVIPLSAGRTAFVIGDVMGRGVRAAAIMGQLRAAIRAYTVSDLPPDLLVDRLSTLVRDMAEDLIATCTVAVLNQTEDTLTYASAGHLPPAVVNPEGEVRLLDLPVGPPLGVPESVYALHETEFPAGSRMLLFTDGLVEHRDRSLDHGLAALSEQLRSLDGTPEVVCKELIGQLLGDGEQADDVTLLMVANTGLGPRDHAEREFPPEARTAAEARHFVTEVLTGWRDHEHLEQVVAAVNEVVVNALAHARTPITLRLHRLPRAIVAEVEDLDARQPRRRDPEPEDENHRGLHIVATLATRWGARNTPTGKVVWAEFATAPRARASAGSC